MKRPFLFLQCILAACFGLAPLLPAVAQTQAVQTPVAAPAADKVDIKGHKYERTIDLDGAKLQLNGGGVRYKFIVPVYTAGMWTAKRVGTEAEFFAAPGPKRFKITMLRAVDANELGKLFMKGVQDNIDPKDVGKAMPGIARMGRIFADAKKVNPGDTITMEWVPSKNATVIYIRGVQQGEPFAEPAFYRALMGVWLGDKVADSKLKAALLSGKVAQ